MPDVIYQAPSGQVIRFGRGAPSPSFPWAEGLPSGQWTELPMTRHYDWAVGPSGIAQSGYRGSSPLVNTVNAYCDPATDQDTGDQYFFGGGHGDSSCNALYANRAASLEWEVVEPATPPSVYLPGYMVGGGTITYPSGAAFNGRGHELATYFKAADELDPVLDAGYIAPKKARASTHMYQAAVYRKRPDGSGQVHYFYRGYSVYDIASHEWGGFEVNLEAQLAQFKRVGGVWKIPAPGETGDGASLGSSVEVWGVSAIHDPGTDRGYFLVTGGGYRNHIAQFNYDTRLIETVYPMVGLTATNNSFFCRAGRKLYIFANEGAYETYIARRGYIFDLDTKAMRRFDTGGATMPQILGSKSQETIPGWYDSNRGIICRWNYGVSLTTIHMLELTRVSGSGTHADPDILMQSTREVSIAGGDFPGPANKVAFVCGRITFIPAADCVRLILRSETTGGTGRYWALRLS